MRGLFFTGTDTGVGKTYLVSRLARTLRERAISVGVYKPACSGSERDPQSGLPRWEDVEAHYHALNKNFSRDQICPQRFQAALAPPLAARVEGKEVDSVALIAGVTPWTTAVDWLLIEGVGGWKCPLAKGLTIADFAMELTFPVWVVAANRLGVINHTLLTVESIQQAGLPVAGIVLNETGSASDESISGNQAALAELLPNIPCVPSRPHDVTAAIETIISQSIYSPD